LNLQKIAMTKKQIQKSAEISESAAAINLERYVPAYFTWIANKLSRGASQHYLSLFGTGIESWRCLVLLAQDGSISAQQVSRVIGMDKGSVSRCFKSMQDRGLISTKLDPTDGRARIAVLTKKGRELHDEIRGVALAREQAFISVLNPNEVDLLIGLLRRLHENLPSVEIATKQYISEHVRTTKAIRLKKMVASES
jgi:DNA-binding MarR family transcriptional regulator